MSYISIIDHVIRDISNTLLHNTPYYMNFYDSSDDELSFKRSALENARLGRAPQVKPEPEPYRSYAYGDDVDMDEDGSEDILDDEYQEYHLGEGDDARTPFDMLNPADKTMLTSLFSPNISDIFAPGMFSMTWHIILHPLVSRNEWIR